MREINNNLNVLMVTPRYFPYMGGIETHVYEVGRRLSQRGAKITLLTTAAHEMTLALPREDEIEGMRVIRVKAWPRQRDYYLAPEIYAIIKQGKWDLMHCQGCHTLVPPLAMLAAKEAGIPYMLTFHTGGHSANWRNRIRSMQWQLLRPLLKDATKLIGVSHFEADYFRDMLHIPQERFSVIPNGAALPELESVPEQTSGLIISVGRLEKYKGHQHLITALPEIRKQRPDAHLLILGTGPYEEELLSLARQMGVSEYVQIRAVPSGERRAMAEQLSRAMLVALLSEYEAHPIAVMESLGLRKPVLVADTSGLREIAEQGFARMVSLRSTPEEIAQAALQQIEEPIMPPEDFTLPTWEDCAQKLHALYSSIAQGRVAQCVS